MWTCAYTFYLRSSNQSSDNTKGKRKVQVYFCYWGWGWGMTLIKAGLAGGTPKDTLLNILLTWLSWVAVHLRSLTFRCACKHAQPWYDTKLAVKSTTVRLANTYNFVLASVATSFCKQSENSVFLKLHWIWYCCLLPAVSNCIMWMSYKLLIYFVQCMQLYRFSCVSSQSWFLYRIHPT